MQPFFRPDPLACDPPRIHMGGVGPAMTALAGEVADGLMTHPTNTAPRYLREVAAPRLAKGAARTGRDAAELALMVCPLTATGPGAAAVKQEREGVRQLLTFLYSTPSYWPSLELFGWKERGEMLPDLTRRGAWSEMAGLVDDARRDTVSPTGTYSEIAGVLADWYGDLTDWITFPMPTDPARDADAAKVIAKLREG